MDNETKVSKNESRKYQSDIFDIVENCRDGNLSCGDATEQLILMINEYSQQQLASKEEYIEKSILKIESVMEEWYGSTDCVTMRFGDWLNKKGYLFTNYLNNSK